MSTKQRRVTLALKWHYLDNLEVSDIQQRFEDEGIGSYAESTIRRYLNEDPADEVLEMIEEEHANARLQIAEREERMFQRARSAEAQSLEDQPIVRVVPKTETVSNERESPMRWPAWEIVDPGDDDWPEWATERDIIIRFLENEMTSIMPGGEYPLQAIDGSPRYTKELDGLERDQPDLQGQQMARQEQSQHLQAKGDVLGIYSMDINMNVDGEMDTTVSLDEATAAAIREADLEEDDDE